MGYRGQDRGWVTGVGSVSADGGQAGPMTSLRLLIRRRQVGLSGMQLLG